MPPPSPGPERPEDPLRHLRLDPRSRIRDRDLDLVVRRGEREVDTPSRRRPLDRVRDQVRDDLQDAVAVGDEHGVTVELELVLDAARVRLRRERRVGALAEHAHVDLLAPEREAARVELREVENVTDEPLEPHRLLRDDLERALLRGLVVDDSVPQRGDVPADRGQRSAQLVRDRHEEVAGELLRLRELRGHLVEPSGEPVDLGAGAGVRRQRDVVVARRDLVGSGRERLERPRDPA